MSPDELVDAVVGRIWADLNGRVGFDLDELDDDIQEEIREAWRAIIKVVMLP